MTATSYSIFYNITPALLPVMQQLNPADWHFLRHKENENGEVVINTGWYSGTGAFCRRKSIAPKLIAAARKCGFNARKIYEGRQSAKNERVKITIPMETLKQQSLNQ